MQLELCRWFYCFYLDSYSDSSGYAAETQPYAVQGETASFQWRMERFRRPSHRHLALEAQQ